MAKKEILLHTCCAPCATACIDRLHEMEWKPILFFSNSNINTLGEFEKRLQEVQKLADFHKLKLIVDPFTHEAWLAAVRGLENSPEKGPRCLRCFAYSFARTSEEAGGRPFSTTLTVSPHKNSLDIFKIGAAHDNFESIDFKKKDGFKKSLEISKKMGLYRQSYCGCEFSYRAQPPA